MTGVLCAGGAEVVGGRLPYILSMFVLLSEIDSVDNEV